MSTKYELKDGPFIVKKVLSNELNKSTMAPLDYCSLSGVNESEIISIKTLKDIADISSETINPHDNEIYELINLEHIDKTIGEVSTVSIKEGNEIQSSKHKIYYGDIIFSKLRPYLNNVSLINFKPLEKDFFIGSSEFVRITTKNNPYYLFLVLRSKFVLYQTSASHGSIRPRLNKDKIELLEIPYIKDSKIINSINSLVKEILNIRREANLILNNLIEEFNAFQNINDSNDFYIKKISKEELNKKRMDSNYYILNDLQDMIKNHNYISLTELFDFSNDRINDLYKSDDNIYYITTSDVNKYQKEIVNWEEKIYKPTFPVNNKAPDRAKMLLKPNQILIPYLKLSIGTIGWVPNDLNNFIATNGFAVLNPKNNDYGLLFLVLSSDLVIKQLKLLAAGTIMEDIRKEDIEKVILINLNDDKKIYFSEKTSPILKIKWEVRKIYNELLLSFEEVCTTQDISKFNETLDYLNNNLVEIKNELITNYEIN